MQYGARPHAGSVLGPLVLVLAGALVGAILIPVTRLVVTHFRTVVHGRRARRRQVHAAAGAERRARALMSELCPHGWHARVHLYDAAAVTETGESVGAPVALDWFELAAGGSEPVVMRRVWAQSVAEALEAMVADRRTDETLEQIELQASADGAYWPDL